jgi:polysaccharide deacetylase family protein (PEP-CTERM system associated)
MPEKKRLNALTIDVEDYFQVHAFSAVSRYDTWDRYEVRIERNTDRILDILEKAATSKRGQDSPLPIKATFFILGWIAERYPHVVRAIKKAGHEIASHGYAHQVIYNQTKDEFRSDVRRGKTILEEITGEEIIGYRAPSYSITPETLWALEILREEGFHYDSSIFPVYHDIYGLPGAPRFPFAVLINGKGHIEFSEITDKTRHAALLEFPISTVKAFGANIPIAGGGYFRLFPYAVTKYGLRRINDIDKQPFIFYLHPWECDPEQPKITGAGARSQFRHRINLNKTEHRFQRLLGDFQFTSVRDMLYHHI